MFFYTSSTCIIQLVVVYLNRKSLNMYSTILKFNDREARTLSESILKLLSHVELNESIDFDDLKMIYEFLNLLNPKSDRS